MMPLTWFQGFKLWVLPKSRCRVTLVGFVSKSWDSSATELPLYFLVEAGNIRKKLIIYNYGFQLVIWVSLKAPGLLLKGPQHIHKKSKPTSHQHPHHNRFFTLFKQNKQKKGLLIRKIPNKTRNHLQALHRNPNNLPLNLYKKLVWLLCHQTQLYLCCIMHLLIRCLVSEILANVSWWVFQ